MDSTKINYAFLFQEDFGLL